jgi:hypothetical protein
VIISGEDAKLILTYLDSAVSQKEPDKYYDIFIESIPRDLLMRIRDNLSKGLKLAAIKEHFNYSNKSLKESRDIVNRIFKHELTIK